MDDDPELQALQMKRMQELQAQMGGGPSMEQMKQQEQKMAQMEEQRTSILSQILDSSARERLNRIRVVKPEKCRAIEDMLIGAVRSGQIGRIDEAKLISLLEQMSEQQKPKVNFKRRGLEED